MLKEIIICITIVTTIVIGNGVTQKYTTESVDEMVNLLNNIRTEISENEENIDISNLKSEIDNLKEEWEKRHEKLAFYIEHDELEKVETNLTGLEGEIEGGEYGEVMSRLDQSVFLLEHIEDKYKFNLQNIF